MDVLYEGIRLTPEQIVKSSVEEDVHIIGLSILSGSHIQLVSEIMKELKKIKLTISQLLLVGSFQLKMKKYFYKMESKQSIHPRIIKCQI